MIIGIDGNEANEKNRVGVNQYAFWLLKTLAKLQKEWHGTHSFIIYLKNPPRDDLPKAFKGWEYKILPGEGMWILKVLTPHLLKQTKLDLFFAPSHYLPPLARAPMVCSIMDLGYLENTGQFKKKDYWQLKYWSAISMKRSKRIITISKSAQKDIAHYYTFAKNKTVTIPLGYDKDTFSPRTSQVEIDRVKKKYKIDGEYILFLSTLKPSKNIEGLLSAFAQITNNTLQRTNLKLVIAGKKGWLYEPIFRKVQDLKLEKKVIFTDFIPEGDKAPLIAGAKVFTAPSFWEGFGIQVLEAMACGVPVVISDIASLPEVGGKAAIYCDPNKVETIVKALEKVLSMSKSEYNTLKLECVNQARKFSWERTARETLKVFEEVGKKKH
jgi:glycosyltransferase involved in cell wall biosynthesis